MKRNEIQEKFVEILRDELGYDDTTVITAATRLEEDLDADSLDCVEIIMATEHAFDIDIPVDYTFQGLTVEKCIDYIEHQLNANH